MPRVSIIIPMYNCESYVADAVRSVLAQQYRDFELIVVDDGSTDGSRRALQPFEDSIRILSQPNAGVATARNSGLQAAQGELIAFLDADDWWAPAKLGLQLAALDRFPDAGLVFSDFSVMDARGVTTLDRGGIRWKYGVVRNAANTTWSKLFDHSAHVSYVGSDAEHSAPIYKGQISRWLFMGNMINTCSVLMRRTAVEKTGQFDCSLSTEEDYDYWLRLARNWPFIYVDTPLLAFRRSPGQLTRPDQIEKIVRNVIRVLTRARIDLTDVLDPAQVRHRMARVQRDLGEICLRTGRTGEARDYLRQSLRQHPARVSTYALLALALTPPSAYRRIAQLAGALRSRK